MSMLTRENSISYFNEYLTDNRELFDGLAVKEKDFKRIEDGYFVLLPTVWDEPEDVLKDYFKRTASCC